MLKNKSFYITWVMVYLVLALPNMMFQMCAEKRMFQEDPLLFFGSLLVGSFLCAFVIHKNFINKK